MTSTKLNKETLESWLWDSANILRGSIDSSDFKNYIFGLLFLKRSNDIFEEEVENIMKQENASREDAEEDVFFHMPDIAKWDYLKTKTENIGVAIDKAFAKMEELNSSTLEGVMTATKFGDTERLSDDTLMRLMSHFNKHSLRNADLEHADLLGDAYEYLIKQFADDAGKKGGEFYTPRGVVKLIVRLIKPQLKHRVYDPTCGSCGMLIEAARYVAAQKGAVVGNSVNISLAGQEKNLGTWAIGKLNMLLHGYVDADIQKGDTLTNPQHTDNGSLKIFDRILANPPFSQKMWWTPLETKEIIKIDRNGKEKKVIPNYAKDLVDTNYGRFVFGTPPRGAADMAFLQHMIAVLADDGMIGTVLPHGSLFRGSSEGKIRKAILEKDLVEAIVGLPSALFYNTGIPACIWIINKRKAKHLKNKVIVIDASRDYKEGKNQNELLAEHIDKVVNAYDAQKEVDKYMRVVDMEEIAENDYNLNISRYIDTSEPEAEVDLQLVQQNITEIAEKEAEIDALLAGYLKELGL